MQSVINNITQLPGRGFPCIFYMFVFVNACAQTIFIARCLRIHPVQSVVNNITQLSGRGFPCIFYMFFFVSQLYVFSVLRYGRRA